MYVDMNEREEPEARKNGDAAWFCTGCPAI
jgi:hypothetical protein